MGDTTALFQERVFPHYILNRLTETLRHVSKSDYALIKDGSGHDNPKSRTGILRGMKRTEFSLEEMAKTVRSFYTERKFEVSEVKDIIFEKLNVEGVVLKAKRDAEEYSIRVKKFLGRYFVGVEDSKK